MTLTRRLLPALLLAVSLSAALEAQRRPPLEGLELPTATLHVHIREEVNEAVIRVSAYDVTTGTLHQRKADETGVVVFEITDGALVYVVAEHAAGPLFGSVVMNGETLLTLVPNQDPPLWPRSTRR